MELIQLSYGDVAWSAALAVALATLFWFSKLGLSRVLLVASLRMAIQLLLIGFVLRFLFETDRPWLVVLIALAMLAVAAREVVARQKRRLRGWRAWRLGAGTLFVSSFAVTLYGLLVVVQPEPLHSPQYVIPLLGMVLSNTMSAISLAMDRLTETVYAQRAVVEQRLALGESARQAISGYARDCLRSGMMPVINSMATAGIVALPGMMTGQILAGASPLEAVKYQIMIWFLIAGGCGFGIAAALWLLQRQLFDERERLRLERLS